MDVKILKGKSGIGAETPPKRFTATDPRLSTWFMREIESRSQVKSRKVMDEKPYDGGYYLIRESKIKEIEGKLLTLAEAGLGKGDLSSTKSILSQELWNLLEPNYIWVDDESVVHQSPGRTFINREKKD